MSDSDEMEIDVSDRDIPDDSICPTCKKSTYVGETISCETCMYWFHFQCVGVTHDDECVKSEDVPYFCPACSGRPVAKLPAAKSGRKQPQTTGKNNKGKKKEPAPSKAAKETPKATKESARKASSKRTLLKPLEISSPVSAIPAVKSPPIKLKISLGKQKGQQQTPSNTQPPEVDQIISNLTPLLQLTPSSSGRKRHDSEEEEEKWLDAVESGNLHTVDDELKRIRDPKLMTARQRAMVTKKSDSAQPAPASAGLPQSPATSVLPSNLFLSAPISLDESGHVSLDFGGKKKVVSEEVQQEQRAIKSQKRKELELVKREEDKKKTMDRLLLKKDSKATKQIKASSKKSVGQNLPKWTYRLTAEGATFSLPPGVDFPLSPQKLGTTPTPVKCSISDCQNVKRYNCSKTGQPLCSLACYRKNLTSISA